MMTKFHNNKFYRVKEKIDKNGTVKYVVQSSNSKIDVLFGLWREYEKLNETLDEAIEQIKFIDGYKLISEKIVYTATFD